MTAAGLFLPVADHGDLVSTLPFFVPVLVLALAFVAMRIVERRRDDEGSR